MESLLREHLARRGLGSGLHGDGNGSYWRLEADSKLGGRGLVAARPIPRGQLVYADRALMLGPRARPDCPPLCAVCLQARGDALRGCERGCGLPVCSDACQRSAAHLERECAYLRALRPACAARAPGWGPEALWALVPLRALFLEPPDKLLLAQVQAHEASRHGREVELLQRGLAGRLPPSDEQFMRRVCRVMDTNSFETALPRGHDSATSLRALFPLGALTNHQCVPNTRHLVNRRGELLVYATLPIAEGQEITMAYSELLWDTATRRHFLQATKHFSCRCDRCSDPTEHGTFLAALRCANASCLGLLLPDQPLNYASAWTCTQCRLVIKHKQIASIRAGITAATEEVLHQSPRQVLLFIRRQLPILIPDTHYLMMQMMFRVVSLLGRVDGFTWRDLTDDDLNTKIQYCHKLIECLDTLNCGDCTKRGLVLYELYLANAEKHKRLSSCVDNSIPTENQVSSAANERNLTKALEILKDDIVAPSDYRQIYTSKLLMAC